MALFIYINHLFKYLKPYSTSGTILGMWHSTKPGLYSNGTYTVTGVDNKKKISGHQVRVRGMKVREKSGCTKRMAFKPRLERVGSEPRGHQGGAF